MATVTFTDPANSWLAPAVPAAIGRRIARAMLDDGTLMPEADAKLATVVARYADHMGPEGADTAAALDMADPDAEGGAELMDYRATLLAAVRREYRTLASNPEAAGPAMEAALVAAALALGESADPVTVEEATRRLAEVKATFTKHD